MMPLVTSCPRCGRPYHDKNWELRIGHPQPLEGGSIGSMIIQFELETLAESGYSARDCVLGVGS